MSTNPKKKRRLVYAVTLPIMVFIIWKWLESMYGPLK